MTSTFTAMGRLMRQDPHYPVLPGWSVEHDVMSDDLVVRGRILDQPETIHLDATSPPTRVLTAIELLIDERYAAVGPEFRMAKLIVDSKEHTLFDRPLLPPWE